MRRLSLVAALAALAGCSAFHLETPPSMIELKNQASYDYRAMTPDGVVLGVRVVDDAGKTDVAFWTEAITLHMNELSGYALLGASDVTSENGSHGKELRFGHDEAGKPYVYAVRIFVRAFGASSPHRLILVEVGGAKDEMERNRAVLDAAMASIYIR
jgi:hypothetical protein